MNGIGKNPREEAIPNMYPLRQATIAVPIIMATGVGGGRMSDIVEKVYIEERKQFRVSKQCRCRKVRGIE